MADAGCRVQDAKCKMQNAKCEVRGARCEVRGARREVRGARCEVRGARREVRGASAKRQTPNARCQMPDARCQMPDADATAPTQTASCAKRFGLISPCPPSRLHSPPRHNSRRSPHALATSRFCANPSGTSQRIGALVALRVYWRHCVMSRPPCRNMPLPMCAPWPPRLCALLLLPLALPVSRCARPLRLRSRASWQPAPTPRQAARN